MTAIVRSYKLFWVIARRVWSGWKQALLVLEANFQVQRQVGRKQTPKEIRELIFQMVAENPTWGAPRIMGDSACSVLISPREPSPAG
jgi:hypothetical protein